MTKWTVVEVEPGLYVLLKHVGPLTSGAGSYPSEAAAWEAAAALEGHAAAA